MKPVACAKTSTHSDVGDSVFDAKLTVSKLEGLILRTISEFWGFWKVATDSHSFPLHCSEGASSAPDNVLSKCPSMQQGDLGQNPALNRIQWDPSPLHRLWHCQWMHTCCYTLSQSAQSLGQKGGVPRQEQLGFSHSVHLSGPHYCSCPFPVLHWCHSAAQRAGGWWAPAPCYLVF